MSFSLLCAQVLKTELETKSIERIKKVNCGIGIIHADILQLPGVELETETKARAIYIVVIRISRVVETPANGEELIIHIFGAELVLVVGKIVVPKDRGQIHYAQIRRHVAIPYAQLKGRGQIRRAGFDHILARGTAQFVQLSGAL